MYRVCFLLASPSGVSSLSHVGGVLDLGCFRMRGLKALGEYSIFILTANRGANGAREYIGIASTDEWMSCREHPI